MGRVIGIMMAMLSADGRRVPVNPLSLRNYACSHP